MTTTPTAQDWILVPRAELLALREIFNVTYHRETWIAAVDKLLSLYGTSPEATAQTAIDAGAIALQKWAAGQQIANDWGQISLIQAQHAATVAWAAMIAASPQPVAVSGEPDAWAVLDEKGEVYGLQDREELADMLIAKFGNGRYTKRPLYYASPHPEPAQDGNCDRESLGKMVRAIWIDWAREQPAPKPSWLAPWDELAEPDREVDRRIGEKLFKLGERIGRFASEPESAAPAVSWNLPAEGAYLIRYDDAGMADEFVCGPGARDAILHRYAQIRDSWNAHLFAKIDSNSRAETSPNATPAAPAVSDEAVEAANSAFFATDTKCTEEGFRRAVRNAVEAAFHAITAQVASLVAELAESRRMHRQAFDAALHHQDRAEAAEQQCERLNKAVLHNYEMWVAAEQQLAAARAATKE